MKFSKTASIGALASVFALFALTGFAGDPQQAADQAAKQAESQPANSPAADKPAFEKLDTNLDGEISKDEAANSWLAPVFAKVDTDHNGLINKTEYDSAIS